MHLPETRTKTRRLESPNAQTALQKLNRLCILAKFVSDLREISECLGVVGVQHPASLHRALLRMSEALESMRQGIGAEEHFAVVEQHTNVLGMQRRWFADRRTVSHVGWSKRGEDAAAKIEISGEKLETNLETRMSA